MPIRGEDMAHVRLERAKRDAADERNRLYAIISGLEQENAKLRELVQSLYRFSFDEYPDGAELNFADRLRELGIG